MPAILALILLFPLLGALFHLLLGRRSPRRLVEVVACGSVGASLVMALAAVIGGGTERFVVGYWEWFRVGDLAARFDVLYDPLAGLMCVMVTFVAAVVHVYSVGYMKADGDYVRYFCLLNLFVFSMLVITLADNLLFLFLGWEGVGFCSYALIGFWFEDTARATAGRKAFMLTRIGDVAFGVALGIFWVRFGGLSVDWITTHASTLTPQAATLVGLLLLWSAVGKSAQLPLAVWLPDAMAGPTPVSALIHAATMVTAGVYLLMRLFPVMALSPAAMLAVAVVGVVTALFGSLSALAQRDIKRVLAYSTISQLGYMFLAVGAGDIVGGLSYLLSHAFFKSLLFLGAGCVIQAFHEEHDIFRMGSRVRRHLPAVYWLFLAGVCSLGALPPTGGFLNKDRVLVAAFFNSGVVFPILWGLALASSFVTSLYAFRMFFLVFTEQRGEEPAAEPPAAVPGVMVRLLWPLAILALTVGYLNLPPVWGGEDWLGHFMAGVPGAVPHLEVSERVEWAVATLDGFLALVALPVAFLAYGPGGRLLQAGEGGRSGLVRDFLMNGFYLDRAYTVLLARPYGALARFLWTRVDEGTVDRGMVGYGKAFEVMGLGLRGWTTGRLSTYLRMILLGFSTILCVLLLEHYIG